MIIGNGDIASALKEIDRDDLIFFASGVSNSQETEKAEFMRELDLYEAQPPDAHLVYFSTLAVFYGDTDYVHHKFAMESVVRQRKHYTVVRLGNITWGNNPHTLINHFRAYPDSEIRDEERYIIDKEEFVHWIGKIPFWNCEMNITGRRMKIQEIVDEYCN